MQSKTTLGEAARYGGNSVSDQLEFLVTNLPNLLWGFPGRRPGGLLMSLLLAVVSVGVGFVVAVIVGVGHHSRYAMIRLAARSYVWVIRGIPLIVLLFLSLQLFGAGIVTAAFVALILYSSSYQADIIQTGIAAIPQQLIDDSRLLGANRWQVLTTVSLPYSLRVMRPALEGQAITVFKDTSVVVVLGVADLTTNARIALGGDVKNSSYWVATYLLVGTIYFLVAFGFSQASARRAARLPG